MLLGELWFGSLLVITRYHVLALFASVSANLFATVAMGNVNKAEAIHGTISGPTQGPGNWQSYCKQCGSVEIFCVGFKLVQIRSMQFNNI